MKHLRSELGLTQLQVAEGAALDVRYYSRIENGKVNVTLTTLYRLARAMKCPRLLSLPVSPMEELEASLCSSICQMARRGESVQLQQADKFIHHVLGCRPESNTMNGCLAHRLSRGRHKEKPQPRPRTSRPRGRIVRS